MACREFLAGNVVNFLNLGYVGNTDELVDVNSDDVADYVSTLLYEQVVGEVNLAKSKMIEVGCGPGAGSEYLARTHRPASIIGIDLSEELIKWCSERHRLDNLEFRTGDAQKLPISDGSIDAVVNIESSHCYPSRPRFFREVVRVLRPGGSFLFADIVFSGRKGDEVDLISAQLREAGLVIDDFIDITQNVLAARNVASSSSFRARMREKLPAATVAIAEEGFCMDGTTFYTEMSAGNVGYGQWRASKPAGGRT